MMNPKQILNEYQNWAVIGVTPDEEKYANRIYKKLKEKGYKTYGVTPKYDIVDGDHMYKCLKDIQQPIDVVVFVINPKFVTPYLDEMKQLNIRYAWMQPGTYDNQTIQDIQDRDLEMIQACVLVLS